MPYSRYAVYDLPEAPQLAAIGANWLGWDAINGKPAQQPDITGINAITSTPRKYGFHATLKPPFRLANGVNENILVEGVEQLASSFAPVVNDGLKVSDIGKFLALTLKGNPASINQLAFKCVTELEPFRSPLNDAELARRSTSKLTQRQEKLLQSWGYPYVDDEFNYHITLTAKLDTDMLEQWHKTATRYFELPSHYVINSLVLAGEREDGNFELIKRFPLTSRPLMGKSEV